MFKADKLFDKFFNKIFIEFNKSNKYFQSTTKSNLSHFLH